MRLITAYIISIIIVIIAWSHWFTFDFVSATANFFSADSLRDSSIIHYLEIRNMTLQDVKPEQGLSSKFLDVLSKCVTVISGMVLLVITPTLNYYGKQLLLRIKNAGKKKFVLNDSGNLNEVKTPEVKPTEEVKK